LPDVKTYQPFRFKEFQLHQSNSAMKIGTDGVLLGAWSSLHPRTNILDVGTGTGLIALMLAQRFPHASVTGIEINPEAALDTIRNFQESPFAERLQFIHGDFLSHEFTLAFDLIVSNPPYFSNDLLPTEHNRSQARHEETLGILSLLQVAQKLLSATGIISLIIPYNRLQELTSIARNMDLYPARITLVKGRADLPPKRALIELLHEPVSILEDELIIEVERHQYTNAYKSLTKDFYLNM
jgi:tRNA1Val (adenine37-N6)-methyltransferase